MVLEAPKGQSFATGLFWPQAGVVSQSPGNPYRGDRSHPLTPRAPDPRGVGGFRRSAAPAADPRGLSFGGLLNATFLQMVSQIVFFVGTCNLIARPPARSAAGCGHGQGTDIHGTPVPPGGEELAEQGTDIHGTPLPSGGEQLAEQGIDIHGAYPK